MLVYCVVRLFFG